MNLNYYGLLISLGSLIGYLLASYRRRKTSISQTHLDMIFIVCTIGAVIGARLYHVGDKWELYSTHVYKIFFIWQGGIGIFGALIGGFVALLIYCRRYRLDYREVGDVIAPSLLLAQGIGRIGNYSNLEGFGPPTQLPWKLFIPIEHRPALWSSYEYFHPTFFYESLLCLSAFVLLLVVSRYTKIGNGALFGLYLISYGVIRMVTESFRIDTASIGGVRLAYILSSIFIVYGAVLVSNIWQQKYS